MTLSKFTRRHIIAASAALIPAAVLPGASVALPIDFTPGVVRKALSEGQTVFLDFKASWCTTCAAQERVIDRLKSENPAYEEMITFVNVDWDEYGRHEFTKSLNIPRRSTLVVLKQDQELGRIVAGTGEAQIKELMDIALAAAGS